MNDLRFTLESDNGERHPFIVCQVCGALVSYYHPHICPGVTR